MAKYPSNIPGRIEDDPLVRQAKKQLEYLRSSRVEIQENEQKQAFNPDSDGYDYETAKKMGISPDESGHWPSRVPETGLILKGAKHPTFYKTEEEEKRLGYQIVKKDGRYYSLPVNSQGNATQDEDNSPDKGITPIKSPGGSNAAKQANPLAELENLPTAKKWAAKFGIAKIQQGTENKDKKAFDEGVNIIKAMAEAERLGSMDERSRNIYNVQEAQKRINNLQPGQEPSRVDIQTIREGEEKSLEQPADLSAGVMTSNLALTPLSRIAGSFGQGVLSVPEGLAGMGEYAGVPGSEDARKNIQEWGRYIAPDNPNFLENTASGFGSVAVYIPFGLGISSMAEAIASVSPKVALMFGSTAAATLEAGTEAGFVYTELKDGGAGDDAANAAAEKTFMLNVLINAITNKLGIFGDQAAGLKKALFSAPPEGIQELLQQYTSNVQTGKDPLEGVFESGAIGAIVGGSVGGIMPGAEKPKEMSLSDLRPKTSLRKNSGTTTQQLRDRLAKQSRAEMEETARQLVELQGARFEGITKDNKLVQFTNTKTGGTFSLPVNKLSAVEINKLLAADKNGKINKLPEKASKEDLKKAFTEAKKPETIVPANPQLVLEIRKLESDLDTAIKNKKPYDDKAIIPLLQKLQPNEKFESERLESLYNNALEHNRSLKNGRKDEQGISGEIGTGEKPVSSEPEQTAGSEPVKPGGVLQKPAAKARKQPAEITEPGKLSLKTQEFIKKKVAALGSLEAVNKTYEGDAAVNQYARKIATELYSQTPGKTEPEISENPEIDLSPKGRPWHKNKDYNQFTFAAKYFPNIKFDTTEDIKFLGDEFNKYLNTFTDAERPKKTAKQKTKIEEVESKTMKGVPLEKPVARAVDALLGYKKGARTVTSGFQSNFTVKNSGIGPSWSITIDKKTNVSLMNDDNFREAWRAAGLSMQTRATTDGDSLTDIYLQNAGPEDQDKAAAAFDKFADLLENKPAEKKTPEIKVPEEKNIPAAEQSSRIQVMELPLDQVNVNTKEFQGREGEYSEETFNSISKAAKAGKFNWAIFDPIKVWKNPKDGKYYVLAGHSRRAAFEDLAKSGMKEFSTIPAIEYKGATFEEAKKFAIEESNVLGTRESDIARANVYRGMRETGKTEKEIKTRAKELEKNNSNYIYSISFLNPQGKTISALKAFEKSQSKKDTQNLSVIADWIGSARADFTQLTNSHEDEIYDWLIKDNAFDKIRNKTEFKDRIDKRVNNFQFDPEKSLNLKDTAIKSNFRLEYDEEVKKAETTLKNAILDRDKQMKSIVASNPDIPTDELQEKMKKHNQEVEISQKELIKLKMQRERVDEMEDKQGGLFMENKSSYNVTDDLEETRNIYQVSEDLLSGREISSDVLNGENLVRLKDYRNHLQYILDSAKKYSEPYNKAMIEMSRVENKIKKISAKKINQGTPDQIALFNNLAEATEEKQENKEEEYPPNNAEDEQLSLFEKRNKFQMNLEFDQLGLDFDTENSSQYNPVKGAPIKFVASDKPSLRKLGPDEMCAVERRYRAYKRLSFFMPGEKLVSVEDVAYIFRQLEDRSVEHSFILHILGNGKPVVQFLASGSYDSTYADIKAIPDLCDRLGTKKIYFIHNHPSGNLEASPPDYKLLNKLFESLPEKIICDTGIIIDFKRGLFGVFDIYGRTKDLETRTKVLKPVKLKALAFDTQVLRGEINYDKRIQSPMDIARIASALRFGNGSKIQLLIVNTMHNMVGRINLPITEEEISSERFNVEKFANDISIYINRFGGSAGILLGSKNLYNHNDFKSNLLMLKKILTMKDTPLMDYIGIQPSKQVFKEFVSATSLGLFENVSQYQPKPVNEVRENYGRFQYPDSEKLRVMGLYGNSIRSKADYQPIVKSDFTESDLNNPKRLKEISIQLMNDIGEVIDEGVRTQNVKRFSKKARGVYIPGKSIIRINNINDLSTFVHEIGHKLDYELFNLTDKARYNKTDKLEKLVVLAAGRKDAKVRNKILDKYRKQYGNSAVDSILERAELRKELIDFLKSEKYPNKKIEEGVAEFIRIYVTNPALAVKSLPKFNTLFENIIKQNPQLDRALLEARRSYEAFETQDPRQKLEAAIHRDTDENSILDSIRDTWESFYINVIDGLKPFRQLEEALLKVNPGMKGIESPLKQVMSILGNDGKVDQFLYYKPFLKKGNEIEFQEKVKPLFDIITPILESGRLKSYEGYLVAKRNLELLERKLDEAATTDEAQSKQVIELYEKELGKEHLEEFSQSLYDYQAAVLEYYKASGKMSDEQYSKALELNKFYIPFQRYFDEWEASNKQPHIARYIRDSSPSPVKGIRGSSREIVSPMGSIIKNTYDLLVAADRNTALKTVVDALNAINPKTVLEVPKSVIRGEMGTDGQIKYVWKVVKPKTSIITIWEEGKLHYYEIPKEYYESFFSISDSVGRLIKILSLPSRWLQAGAVQFDPTFAVRNVPRDQVSALFYTKFGYNPFHFMKGISSYVKKDEIYQKFLASGADQSFLTAVDEHLSKSYIEKKAGKKIQTKLQSYVKNWDGPLKFMQDFNRVSEIGTRVAAFKNAYLKSGDVYTAMQEGRDIAADYSVKGQGMRAIAPLYPFLNARIQHLRMSGTKIVEDPLNALQKGTLWIMIPAILNWLNNNRDEEISKLYQDLPEWRRIGFFNINIPGTEWFFSIPKGFWGTLFGTTAEYGLDYLKGNEAVALGEVLKGIGEEISPISNLVEVVPQFGRPIIETFFANKYGFTGRPVVSERIENLPPEQQFYDDTPQLLRWLSGEVVGFSPAKAEALVRGYGAGFGQLTLNMSDEALQMIGVFPETETDNFKALGYDLTKVPVIKAFIPNKPIGTSSKSVQDFFVKLDELEGVNKAVNTYIKAYDEEAIQKYLSNPEIEKDYRYYLKNSKTINRFRDVLIFSRQLKKNIIEDDSISDKRAALDSMNYSLTELAWKFRESYEKNESFKLTPAIDEMLKQAKLRDKDLKKKRDAVKQKYGSPEVKKKSNMLMKDLNKSLFKKL